MVTYHSCTLLVILFLYADTTSTTRLPRRNRNQNNYIPSSYDSQTDDFEDVCELELSCKGQDSMPIKLPIRGAQGPPGKPGTPGLPGKQGISGTSPHVVREDRYDQVAFFVGLGSNFGPVKTNQDLIFDRVITNVGRAFDRETSRFTAPYNGTYSFTVTVAAQGRQRAAVEIVHEGKMIATVWAESFPVWASASNTVILNIQEGDQVWLVLLSRASHVHGYMYTTFSGHCLYKGL